MNIRWDESPVRDDLTEPVDITIMTASQSAVVKVMLPGWVIRLPIKLSVAMFSVASLLISIVFDSFQRIQVAFADLDRFLHSEIADKRKVYRKEGHLNAEHTPINNTVFDRLVTASQSEGGKGLSDREIAGNLFIFFFAGVRVPPTTTSLH